MGMLAARDLDDMTMLGISPLIMMGAKSKKTIRNQGTSLFETLAMFNTSIHCLNSGSILTSRKE